MSCLIRYNPNGSYLLPSGFQRLSYIQSTGRQWIDTEWNPSSNTQVQIQIRPLSIPTNNHFFGSRASAATGGGYAIGFISTKLVSDFNGSRVNFYTPRANELINILKKGVNTKINGISLDNANSTFSVSYPLYLLALNESGKAFITTLSAQLYNCRIWEGDIIKRDFVPVQTTAVVTSADGTSCPSGSIGLLDLVENKFYQNKGTGTFTAGPECPQGFPTSEYCQAEWLGNEKATGYVAIPYTHKANTWVDTEMSFDSFYAWNTMFGACTADNGSDSFTFGCYTGGRINCDLGAKYSAAFGMTAGTFYRFLVSSKTIIKDTTTYNPNKTTTACDKTWALFTRHNNTSYTDEAGHGKFKYMKIYEGTFNSVSGSTLKAHLIPCYRRSDMKPGFYDLVGRSFHEFVGTGASLGPSITFGWGEVMNGVGEWQYLRMNITQKKNTGEYIQLSNIRLQTLSGRNYDWSGASITSNLSNSIYGETVDKLLDNSTTTKYCDTSQGSSVDCNCVITINAGKKIPMGYYKMLCWDTANDAETRDPKTFNFQISNDGTNWYTIASETNYWCTATRKVLAWSKDISNAVSLPAIPYNISTGDGRNGEKNGSFTGGYISTSRLESLKNSNFTIAGWFYPTKSSVQANNALMSLGNTKNGAVILETNRYFSYSTAATGYSNIPLNTWTHISLVRDGDILKYYKNGVYQNQINCANMVDTNELWVGARIGGSVQPCKFQDIQVWDEIKNPAELM